VALSLPLVLACVIAVAGLRVHDGRVERSVHVSAAVATPASAATSPADGSTVGQVFRQHLTMSVPWPAFAALLVLCMLPAVASLLAWSGSRRGSKTGVSAERAW
jgi:hypothetical protein